MANSIIQKHKECYICRAKYYECNVKDLELHHIVYGRGRRIEVSDKNGFVVWLCSFHHKDSRYGVHHNAKYSLTLKRICQTIYEEKHSREDWIKLVGKNYL